MRRASSRLRTVLDLDDNDTQVGAAEPRSFVLAERLIGSTSSAIGPDDVAAALNCGDAFVIVTAAPGAEKTTLPQRIAERCGPRTFTVVLDTRPASVDDLLMAMLIRMGLVSDAAQGDSLDHRALLNVLRLFLASLASLHAQAVLIVDEAHRLPQVVVEEILRLTDTRIAGRRQLQAVFVQPELNTLLVHPDVFRASQDALLQCEPAFIAGPAAEDCVRRSAVGGSAPVQEEKAHRVTRFAQRLNAWWPYLATAAAPALAIAAGTAWWSLQTGLPAGGVRQSIAPSAPPADALTISASSGPGAAAALGARMPGAVQRRPSGAPPPDNGPIDTLSGTSGRDLGGSLDALMRRVEHLAQQPDVRALAQVREELVVRQAGVVDVAERAEVESALSSLDRHLAEARRLQLQADGKQLSR